jgi:transglutaminase-like putative cysteine protease
LAAVALASTGVSISLLGFSAFAVLAGAFATRAGAPTSRQVRGAWLNASAVFALLVLLCWLLFEVGPEQALVVICLFLFLRCWLIERREWDYLQIWVLSTVLLHVAALALGGIWGVLVVLGWAVSTIQVFNVLASIRGNPGGDPYRSAPQSLSSATRHLPVFLVLTAVVMLALPRYTSPKEDRNAELHAPTGTTRTTGVAAGGIDLSNLGRLESSPVVAFRVINPPATLLPQMARFRVDVLDEFDGLRWSRRSSTIGYMTNSGGAVVVREDAPVSESSLVRYEIWLAAHQLARPPLSRRTVALEKLPLDVAVGGFGDGTVEFQAARPPSKWQVLATVADPFPSLDRPLPHHLAIPAPLQPDVEHLAGEIYGSLTAREVVIEAQHAAQWLRRHGRYTLDLSSHRSGIDGVQDFLGGRLEGHCELFATALALVLRSQGIPARVVVGYRGGEYRPTAVEGSGRPDLVFTQGDALAWVECWTGDGGWLECEATPVNELGPAAVAGDSQAHWSASLRDLAQLGAVIDEYDAESQQALWGRLKGRAAGALQSIDEGSLWRAGERFAANAQQPAFLWLLLLLGALNAGAWWLRFRLGKRWFAVGSQHALFAGVTLTPPLMELTRRLRHRGLSMPATLMRGPSAFIRDAVGMLGGSGELADSLSRIYQEWRFGSPDAARAETLLREYAEVLARVDRVGARGEIA